MGNERGQFMIEAIIGVGILGLLVIFILSAFSARYVFDKTNTLRTEALYVAEQGLEFAKAHPQAVTSGSLTTEDYGSIPLYPNYKREYQIQQEGSADMNLYLVTVVVKWKKSQKSQERQLLSLTTIITGQ